MTAGSWRAVGNTDSGGVNTAIYLWDATTGTNLLVSATMSNTVPSNAVCYAPWLMQREIRRVLEQRHEPDNERAIRSVSPLLP